MHPMQINSNQPVAPKIEASRQGLDQAADSKCDDSPKVSHDHAIITDLMGEESPVKAKAPPTFKEAFPGLVLIVLMAWGIWQTFAWLFLPIQGTVSEAAAAEQSATTKSSSVPKPESSSGIFAAATEQSATTKSSSVLKPESSSEIFAAATEQSAQTKSSSVPMPESSSATFANANWLKNITYEYSSRGSCSSRASTQCLDFQQYKSACMASAGATIIAFRTAASYALEPERTLLNNQRIRNIKTVWGTGNDRVERCYVTAELAGSVNGTDTRIDGSYIASSFIVSEESGELLVHFLEK